MNDHTDSLAAMTLDSVHRLTNAERLRQLTKWGEQNHQDGTSEDNEQIAELAKESCEAAFAGGTGSWLDVLLEEVMEASAETDPERLKEELVQVAAVAESWVAAIDRRYNPDQPPSRNGLERHQVWVWMNGPGHPHWEIRGTGALLEDDAA